MSELTLDVNVKNTNYNTSVASANASSTHPGQGPPVFWNLHLFYEQHIDLSSKTSILNVTKEPLKRNPRQIEVEKALIREDMEDFSAQLTFKWEDYISWQRKLNEARVSAAALKASISGMSSEAKHPESKCKSFFRRSPLEDSQVVAKENKYDKGFFHNMFE
ncbi:hypothetical protein H0E87_009805, partial [Populus deltoides]